MSSGGQTGRSNSLKRKHWSIRAHETLVSRNKDGHFCLNVEGGAEHGIFAIIGDLKQDRINYKMGKLHSEELILEVNHKRVPGLIKKDVIALIKRSADPVSLITVKQNATITKDIRQYLASRFTKNSVDSELQHQMRENLHTRVVPVTTRRPRDGERDAVDYNFISVEQFKRMDKNGELLESGTYENNYYGTPKPPSDPSNQPVYNSYSRSSASFGYSPRDPLPPQDQPIGITPSVSRSSKLPPMSQLMGPLPGNWEIAYTENNEKYFIDHNTGTTHWLDPRMARSMKHSLLECEDDELPYGWEKINDPICGTYFIDHINRNTQYENPVTESKRKYHASQLPNPNYPHMGGTSNIPPPIRAPPSFQTAAALEKQREAEAAAQWPNAGLIDYKPPGGFMQQSQYIPLSPREIEENLIGDPLKVVLTKNPTGFGFTIIGGDRPGELLQIRSIVQGGVADRDGELKVGDVLVRVNSESVVTYNHHKVVDLFQSIPMHSPVELEVRRGYPLPDSVGDELPTYSESNLNNRGYNQTMSYPAAQTGPSQPPDKMIVSIVKGPLGFGFSLSETQQGPIVKQIMDKARCAQLKEGDLILEVNGEKVYTHSHSDLITILKRCPKGNTANFLVMRAMLYNMQPQTNEFYTNDYPDGGEEPFQHLEVHLVRQVSGFGFRIIGGKEEGSQVTIGGVVQGGAADVDGRLQVGDELTHVNGMTVIDASHKEVIQLIAQASQMGEVILGIRRKMPWPASGPFHTQEDSQGDNPRPGPREVIVHRPNMQTSFGFVLQSNTLRTGCMICRLIPGSPAETCGKLYLFDELLIVNGHDVTQMDHGDIVQLIKGSDITIRLVVQQPENKEDIIQMQQMNSDQPMQPAMAVTIPDRNDYPQQSYHDIGNEGSHDRGHGSHEGGGFEVGPQISADLDGFEEEEIHHINFERDAMGFGFSIRGGAEFNSHMFVLRIAEGGAADVDGQLKVADELLEINGNSTEGMNHSDAITIIKHGGDRVQIIIRRFLEHQRRYSQTEHQEFQHTPTHEPSPPSGSNRLSASSKELLNGSNKSPSINTNEKYTREYMNSLGRNRNSIQDQYGPDDN